jgi:hypothetical protein
MQMAKAMAESDAAADNMELQRILKESEDDEIQRKMKESEDDELQRALKLSRMSADSVGEAFRVMNVFFHHCCLTN